DVGFSYPMLRDHERAHTGCSGIAAHRLSGANISLAGVTVNGEAMMAAGPYFDVLGASPATGRRIGTADEEAVGAHNVAVLGHSFWQGRLGSDPNVIGQSIVVNGVPMTVIGIAEEGFKGTTIGARPMVYVPITMRGVLQPGFAGFDNRRSYW